jgi:tetratricopeptide (TPR) repeat protein
MLALLVSVIAVAGPGRSEVTALVPQTVLQISLEAPGFKEDAAMRAQLLQQAPDRGVLAGRLEPAGSTLSILMDRDQPHKSSAQWRVQLGQNAGEPFEVGDVACREISLSGPNGAVSTHFDAYVVVAGLVFDLHAATVSDPTHAGLSRREFQQMVESFRCVFVRFGAPSNLPRDARDAMHRALASFPAWKRTLDGELARKPGDASLSFVQGELLLLTDAKPADVAAAHTTALAGFQKLRTPSTEQRFAWMLSEQAIGLAYLNDRKAADAISHLEKSFEIAGQLRSPARAPTAYALAQAHAMSGNANDAVRYLGEAIQSDADLRDLARKDRVLTTVLADDKRYQALVGH